MLNIIISYDNTAYENGKPIFFPKERSLTEYILPDYHDRYVKFEHNDELYTILCLFAYENTWGKDAYIGKITRITPRENDVRIDYELSDVKIEFDILNSILQVLDLSSWEMNRTHWTIKNVDFEDIKPYLSTAEKPVTVFISYSWTPIRNQEVVFDLVRKLREDRITVIYDKDDLKPGQNINYFMEQALQNNEVDYIIVVCNKDYAEKADNRKGGVGYEAGIIISEIKGAPLQRRVIPVAVEMDSNGRAYLPTAFKELYYIDLTQDTGYDELLSTISKRCEE